MNDRNFDGLQPPVIIRTTTGLSNYSAYRMTG